jgi:hypothetical protein
MPSRIIIGVATGAIAVHFADPDAIRKSSQADKHDRERDTQRREGRISARDLGDEQLK